MGNAKHFYHQQGSFKGSSQAFYKGSWKGSSRILSLRVLATVMGDSSLHHNSNSRNPTFCYIGT